MTIKDRITRAFEQRFNCQPEFILRAPGRVNLLGEHTDYNDGFVLPMAINRSIMIAIRQSKEPKIVIAHSLDLNQTSSFNVEELQKNKAPSWVEYLKGVAWALQEAGMEIRGWEGVLGGDIPIGAGLASSAALELVAARSYTLVSDLQWDAPTMAKLCQKAENRWVGVNCGIMDQMISAGGKAGYAMLIDCRSLDTQHVPLPSGTVVLVMDTAIRRDLTKSEYNQRRKQCEAAAELLGVTTLREVSLAQFESQARTLHDVLRRHTRHVISENERTLLAADAMRRNDATTLGKLMDASHTSLREDFEVTCPALDAIVECARDFHDCYGARMTGAGFGGCAIALVNAVSADAIASGVAECYQRRTGRNATIAICTSTDGAGTVGRG